MFRFERAKFLPVIFRQKLSQSEIARRAGVSFSTLRKAMDGSVVSAAVVGRLATALDINALDYLVDEKPVFTKRKVYVTRADGAQKQLELFRDEDGTTFTAWQGDLTDEEVHSAIAEGVKAEYSTATKSVDRNE